MNQKLKRFKSKAMFTIIGGVIVINPAFAQDTQAQQAPPPALQAEQAEQAEQAQPSPTPTDATTLDTVVVTGMRNALAHSMNTKRNAAGVVDAISAEDIGKFPD